MTFVIECNLSHAMTLEGRQTCGLWACCHIRFRSEENLRHKVTLVGRKIWNLGHLVTLEKRKMLVRTLEGRKTLVGTCGIRRKEDLQTWDML